MQGKGGVIMMKMTKKNLVTVTTLATCIGVGNIATNAIIAKKNENEKDVEDKIIKSNLVWSAIGFTVGLIAHYTIIDRR